MIPGLSVHYDIISEADEKAIIQWLDGQKWSTELSRRTQHYGYEYNYKSTDLIPGEPFSGYISSLSNSLVEQNIKLASLTDNQRLFMPNINQCIVNEYTKDQSIAKHIDGKRGNRPNIFGPIITSISLGEATNFIFINTMTKERVEIYAPRRCLIVMSGDSRYIWTHEIPKRSTVTDNDGRRIEKRPNYRRISLTFREAVAA